MSERRARVRLSLSALRMLLDLPPHLQITAVYQTRDDAHTDRFTIAVAGPYCPLAPPGEPLPTLTPIYRNHTATTLKLLSVDGLDT